jgi:hypothetical protein|tara:strand:+ start:53 stop:754 length:702 start_codon:yes stop_codon:yes gene_type:complete
MDKIETFNQFLAQAGTDASSLPLFDFFINLIIAYLVALLIQYTYVRCGTSVSNRKNLASNFPLLILTTVFVITIVKSSLALSLGLVGALSIVRFRTAVKEPVELLYLFLSIAVGLGLGANQKGISIAAVVFIVGLIWINYLISDNKPLSNQRMVLTISGEGNGKKLQLDLIINLLKKTCVFSNLIRLDEQEDSFEAHFDVEFDGLKGLNKFRESSYFIENNIGITILDNHGLI